MYSLLEKQAGVGMGGIVEAHAVKACATGQLAPRVGHRVGQHR